MCCAAKDSTVARRGILASIGFWAVFDLMTTLAGLYARAAFPGLKAPLMAFPRLADAVLPAFARGLFFAGIISSALASLQGRSLQSSVSLGKDFAGRFFGGYGWDPERWSRQALILTGLCAFGLALWLPSITGLWYAIGSCVVPGLLLPMIGSYVPSLRPMAFWATAALVCAPALSLCWFLLGQAGGLTLWGVEPMLPGLVLSGILWFIGCFLRPPDKVQKPEIC
jgi:SSS family solute:Na+ symporter